MADDAFDRIDEEIEVLQARVDTCRQAIALSRAAIWIGGAVLLLVLTIAGGYRTPAVVFTAIAAILGGTVWFGANKTSREEAEARLAEVEARRTKLFDEVALRNGWRDLTPTVH